MSPRHMGDLQFNLMHQMRSRNIFEYGGKIGERLLFVFSWEKVSLARNITTRRVRCWALLSYCNDISYSMSPKHIFGRHRAVIKCHVSQMCSWFLVSRWIKLGF